MKSFWTYCGSVNVDIMSIENEPDYAEQITYEGCTWTAQNFVDFCKTYASQIGKPIMMPESFNYKFTLSVRKPRPVAYRPSAVLRRSPGKRRRPVNVSGKREWRSVDSTSYRSRGSASTSGRESGRFAPANNLGALPVAVRA
jgi:hypothetical protein